MDKLADTILRQKITDDKLKDSVGSLWGYILEAMQQYHEAKLKDNYYPKEFVEWYVTEGQFKYRFGVGTVPNPLAEAYNFWLNKQCNNGTV